MSRPAASIPAVHRPGAVSRALARDRLGISAVLFFVASSVAPLTVAAGLIPSAYATTGLTGLAAAFLRGRVPRDDPAHHQQRRILRLRHPRPG